MELPTLNLKELERLAINAAMKQTGGSVIQASKLLGMGRATLYRRLNDKKEVPPLETEMVEVPLVST